jgi:hypothetical protein
MDELGLRFVRRVRSPNATSYGFASASDKARSALIAAIMTRAEFPSINYVKKRQNRQVLDGIAEQ